MGNTKSDVNTKYLNPIDKILSDAKDSASEYMPDGKIGTFYGTITDKIKKKALRNLEIDSSRMYWAYTYTAVMFGLQVFTVFPSLLRFFSINFPETLVWIA